MHVNNKYINIHKIQKIQTNTNTIQNIKEYYKNTKHTKNTKNTKYTTQYIPNIQINMISFKLILQLCLSNNVNTKKIQKKYK